MKEVTDYPIRVDSAIPIRSYYCYCFLALTVKYCDKARLKIIYRDSNEGVWESLELTRDEAKGLRLNDIVGKVPLGAVKDASGLDASNPNAGDVSDRQDLATGPDNVDTRTEWESDCYVAMIDFGENATSEESEHLIPRVQLTARIQPESGAYQLSYDSTYYSTDILPGLEHSFHYFIQNTNQYPNQPLAEWVRILPEEWALLDGDFQATAQDWDGRINSSFTTLFERQVQATPDRVAMKHRDQQWTYRELDDKATHMALALSQLGVQLEDRVPVLSDRSIDMAAAVLAIWKLGAVYVPLDPQYPADRIQTILSDCEPKLVMASHADYGCLEGTEWKVVTFHDMDQAPRDLHARSEIHPDQLAYMIYTSGTTGKPKGVMIHHQGMVNHMLGKMEAFQMNEATIIAQTASQCFDISIWQWFSALLVGGKTVIYDNDMILKVKPFLLALEQDQVHIVEFVPSYLQVVVRWASRYSQSLPDMRYVLVTGEIVKPNVVKQWCDQYASIPLVNAYGPTEASDDITHAFLSAESYDQVPIGKPVTNMNIYVVDEDMQVCPIGVKGEIIVAGIGVGQGYWNNPDNTARSFKQLSLRSAASPSRRYYLTGDLGCWTQDGDLLYFGRKDDQVKIKGYRIELLDIDHALSRLSRIQDAVTIVEQSEQGDKRLVSYVIADQEVTVTILKEQLQAYLPVYMIPEHIRILPEFPLTANGKVDKKALQAYEG